MQQFWKRGENRGGMEQNTVDTIRVLISQYSLLHYITVKCSMCSLVKYQSNMSNFILLNNTIHITLYWCILLYNTLQTSERYNITENTLIISVITGIFRVYYGNYVLTPICSVHKKDVFICPQY